MNPENLRSGVGSRSRNAEGFLGRFGKSYGAALSAGLSAEGLDSVTAQSHDDVFGADLCKEFSNLLR